MSETEFNQISDQEKQAYISTYGMPDFLSKRSVIQYSSPLNTNYFGDKMGGQLEDGFISRSYVTKPFTLNTGNPVALDPSNVGVKITPETTTNPGGITTDANGNQVSLLANGEDQYKKKISPLGAMYAKGALGYMNAYNGTPAWWLNQTGRSFAKGNIGGGVAGLLGAGLSGTRDVLAGAGAQNIEDFLKKEGMAKYLEAMNSSMGQENLRNKQANGYSAILEDGGSIEDVPS